MATRENERTFSLHFDIILRPARRSDLPKLEWFGQFTHFRNLFARTYDEQMQNRRMMLVADLGGFPVGQIFIHFSDAEEMASTRRWRGYLYALRVLEPLRRQGIGTQLILEAEAILRQRGYRWAVIAVAKDNPGARQLYERLGYVVFTDDPGIWHYVDHEGQTHKVVEPAWMLQKALPQMRGAEYGKLE